MGVLHFLRGLARRAPAPLRGDYDPTAWQRLDPSWDNHFRQAGWMNYRSNIVEWVLQIQDDCDDLLDAGCHIGHFIEELRRRGFRPRYQGVDVTPRFVERARQRLPAERFAVGDVRALEFPEDAFDLVMCVGVLMHLPELRTPLAEVFRVARKYVLLSVYGSATQTYTRHDAAEGFLNTFYAAEDVLAHVPAGWTLARRARFERPNRPSDNLIYQFLLKRHERGFAA